MFLRRTVLGSLPQTGGHLGSTYHPTTAVAASSRNSRPARQSPIILCQAASTTSSTPSSFTINPSSPPTPSAAELEAREELALRSSDAAIYGIPRSEWLALDKPARYLGNEFGSVHKPWNDAQIRFALTYPEIYEVGASNLGHIILYGLLNQEPGVLCDRAYYPGADMSAMLQRHAKKLFGVESRRPLDQFDVLGFSLSYELGGTNILDMLQMSGIPLSWEERNAAEPKGKPFDPLNGSPPLVFAGGPTATSNPEPFAAFFDFFALGDGEELLVEIGQSLKRSRTAGADRETTLFNLALEVEGCYVPQFYDAPAGWGGAVFPIKEGVPPRIRRRVCAPDPFQQIGLTPYVDTIHNRLTVEIRRGCTRGCRFCQPGMLTRPARDVEPDKVVEAVEWGMRTTGYNEFSLLSLSCSDYLSLPAVGIEIKNRLQKENVSLSLPSQRVDRFDENIANVVTNSGKRSGLTFAPEAGTQRLRDIINKGLTNEELLRGVKTAWDRGWRQVKLYFMIGLPGETDADVMGIAETIEWLQRECRDGKWHLAVNVTISNFSPKPHTPFQWHSVSTAEFRRKQIMLKEACSKLWQVKANFTPVRISAMEDFVSRGDRRVAAVIRRAWELGATNDAWWQSTDTAHSAWSDAIEDVNMTWKYRQVDTGEWDVLEKTGDERYRGQGGGGKGRLDRGILADERLDAPLPWDHIDTGITKFWLKTDLQRALEAATVPDCSHSGLCSECGVCGDEFGENIVFEPPPVPDFKGHYRPDATRAQRLRFRFAKGQDMVFVGHLDMMTTWDRAARRAALPISADESPFAVRQRIYAPLPLSLGATATEDILEIFLTEKRDPEVVRAQLQAQLPPGLDLVAVEEAEVKKIDGSNGEKVSTLLESLEWYVGVVPGAENREAPLEEGEEEIEEGKQPSSSSSKSSALASAAAASSTPGAVVNIEALKTAIQTILAADSLPVTRPSKKRKGKINSADIRSGLMELEVCEIENNYSSSSGGGGGGTKSNTTKTSVASALPLPEGAAVIRFRTGCAFGNAVVTPAVLVDLISQRSGQRLAIAHLHRSNVRLNPASIPQPDWMKLRSLARMEGHLSVQRGNGTGPWYGGLENRIDVS